MFYDFELIREVLANTLYYGEICSGKFWGAGWGLGGGSGWQFMKTRGFLTRGFAISASFLGEKGKHRNIISRKSQESAGRVPGQVPGQIPWTFCLCVFFPDPPILVFLFSVSLLSQRARILKKINLAWTLENFKFSLENFNLAWKLQSRLNFSIPGFRIAHKNRGLVGGSLEIFNLAWKCHSFQSRLKISIPEGDLEIFQDLGPLGCLFSDLPCFGGRFSFLFQGF